MKKEQKLLSFGTCTIKDGFWEWLKDDGWQRTPGSNGLHGSWYDNNWQSYFYHHQDLYGKLNNIFNDCVTDNIHSKTDSFRKFLLYLEKNNQSMEVYYQDKIAAIIGFGNKKYIMPTEWIEVIPFKDYSNLPLSQLKSIGNITKESDITSMALVDDISRNDVQKSIFEKETSINSLNEKMEDIKNAKTKELSVLQAEIDEKIAKLNRLKEEQLSLLQSKLEEMEAMKSEYEKQLFLLDTQIYGIRCYLGETVRFTQVSSGKDASFNTPVVLYQKIRFLDEEMGKAMAIYCFDGNDSDLFIDILKKREDIRNLFAPGEKSISLVKISRTGTYSRQSSDYANVIEKYMTYHGSQLAAIIRNGENVYIGWMDEDRIAISGDNVFMAPEKKMESMEEKTSVKSDDKNTIVSRYFIFSLLQGILDNSNLLSIPEKVNIASVRNNPYIVFSMADGWLNDNRYGYFSDILLRLNSIPLKRGDIVLTAMSITRDDAYSHSMYGRSTRYDSYNNDRGIGDRNRTHDAHIPAFKFLPINKIMKSVSCKVHFKEYEVKYLDEEQKEWVKTGKILQENFWKRNFTEETKIGSDIVKNPSPEAILEYMKRIEKREGIRHTFHNEKEMLSVYEYTEVTDIEYSYEYYISAKKQDSRWRDKTSYANMEIRENEYIPMTYLNSTWLLYAITTGHIGDFRIGYERVSYADSLRYLNKMLEYIREREQEEAACLEEVGLGSWMKEHSDWPVLLTEWKINNKVRKITDYQAERFLKSIDRSGT